MNRNAPFTLSLFQEIEALKAQLDGDEGDYEEGEEGEGEEGAGAIRRHARNISSIEAEIEADRKRLLDAKDEERAALTGKCFFCE